MTMADVLLGTLVVVGLLIALPSLGLLLRALLPAAVERSRGRIARSPLACFLAGLLPAVLLFAGGFALLQQGPPPVKLGGFLLLLSGVILAGTGLAALATLVGDRLPSTADVGRPWRGLLRGAVCLELSFLLPFVGWFGLLPLALVAGTGAAVLGILSAAPAGDAAPAPAAA